MTKLINKNIENINIYSTFNRDFTGDIILVLTNNYDKRTSKINLPEPIINNERYTLFSLSNIDFKKLTDGLYQYQIIDDLGELEKGSMKIQGGDFGQTHEFELYEDGDDGFLTYED